VSAHVLHRVVTRGAGLLLVAQALHAQAPWDPPQQARVAAEVRRFAAEIAAQVSADGPSAWRRFFATGPEFFMAVNGQLQFAGGTAAQRGIDALPGLIRRITLSFGPDLRVDPLTPDLAMLAGSYTEVLVSPKGATTTDHGFLSALAERRAGHWQLRDAHWSSRP
jgi:hypothetical protein